MWSHMSGTESESESERGRAFADWTALNSSLVPLTDSRSPFVKKVRQRMWRKNNHENAINYGKQWQQQQQNEPRYKSVIYIRNILWQCQNGNHLSKYAQL